MLKHFLLSLLILTVIGYGRTIAQQHDTSGIISIIPEPVSLHKEVGNFHLNRATRFVMDNYKKDSVRQVAEFFVKKLSVPTGFQLAVTNTARGASANTIELRINKKFDDSLMTEGYRLKVTSSRVTITANYANGLFYGMQTVLQLLPKQIESKSLVRNVNWKIPAVQIWDYPRFGWRGLMLDVSRHFFPKEVVEDYIDEMAKYKYNVFHWHLSDDQGWRIQIKGLPKLTKTGAWRVPRTGDWGHFDPPQPGEKATDGGFYTQDDIREIVKYAAKRFITILPEIDVPAHSLAAVTAYPELSCTGGDFYVDPGTHFYRKIDNTLCPAKDYTYQFLDTVFTEIAQLFPGKYIHVGGDEAYKGFWKKSPECQALMKKEGLTNVDELQSYFEKKVEKIIESKGKKMIGWDEILEGGLAPGATVMSWRGMSGGIKAAQMHHHVVMTPTTYCYLDLYQGDPTLEPPTYSMLRLSKCYQFNPVPEGVDSQYILGGQGNLWTERVPNVRQMEYMTWPRAFAISECLWSPMDRKNWNDFVNRMEVQFTRLDEANIKYARSAYDPIITASKGNDGNLIISMSTEISGLNIYYSFDKTYPDNFYSKYEHPLKPPKGAVMVRAVTYLNGKKVGRTLSLTFDELEKRMK